MKMTDEEYRMVTNHPYTLHKTYTGEGCAMCGRVQEEHNPALGKLVNGEKKNPIMIMILVIPP